MFASFSSRGSVSAMVSLCHTWFFRDGFRHHKVLHVIPAKECHPGRSLAGAGIQHTATTRSLDPAFAGMPMVTSIQTWTVDFGILGGGRHCKFRAFGGLACSSHSTLR